MSRLPLEQSSISSSSMNLAASLMGVTASVINAYSQHRQQQHDATLQSNTNQLVFAPTPLPSTMLYAPPLLMPQAIASAPQIDAPRPPPISPEFRADDDGDETSSDALSVDLETNVEISGKVSYPILKALTQSVTQNYAEQATEYFQLAQQSSGKHKRKLWADGMTEWLLDALKNRLTPAMKAPGDTFISTDYFSHEKAHFLEADLDNAKPVMHAFARLLAIWNYFLGNKEKKWLEQSYKRDQSKRQDDFIELLVKLQTPVNITELSGCITETGIRKRFNATQIPVLSFWRPGTQEYQDLRLDLVDCVNNRSITMASLTTAARLFLQAQYRLHLNAPSSLENEVVERNKVMVYAAIDAASKTAQYSS